MSAVHAIASRTIENPEPDVAEPIVAARPLDVRTTITAHPGALRLDTTVDTGHAVDHGGRVLAHVDIAPIYLGDYWATAAGKKIRSHNDDALAKLVTTRGQAGIWKQYGAGTGTTSPSVAIAARNPARMTQGAIEALLEQQIAERTLDTSNRERVFTLVLPPGCELVTNSGESSHHGLGGFHGSVTLGGREVYYSALAFSKAGNGIAFTPKPADNLSIAESHEITEAVTDPDIALAMRRSDPSLLGWYDDSSHFFNPGSGRVSVGKGEVGDIPVINAQLAGDRTLRSAWDRIDGFAFQKEWSQTDHQSELTPKR